VKWDTNSPWVCKAIEHWFSSDPMSAVQPGKILNVVLQVTNKTDLSKSSHPVLSVYYDNHSEIYPKHVIHDIIPEGKK
jgi:hypothetical protein